MDNTEENKDPIFPETPVDIENNGGNPPEDAEKPVSASIGDRLSRQESPESVGSDVVKAETPLPFDISKMSKEQLQTLKAMLGATPDGITRKVKKPTIKIRTINGNIVQDFKNAYLAVVKDSENNRDVERHVIPVKFFGSSDFADIRYSKFIQAEFTTFEVLGTRREVEEIIEGETISRETGTPVEMIVRKVHDFFTIKLPTGETVEVPSKIANA